MNNDYFIDTSKVKKMYNHIESTSQTKHILNFRSSAFNVSCFLISSIILIWNHLGYTYQRHQRQWYDTCMLSRLIFSLLQVMQHLFTYINSAKETIQSSSHTIVILNANIKLK